MSFTPEDERNHVVNTAESRREFDMLEDGFYYWFPTPNMGGMQSHHLRWLADELDRRNSAWQKQINDYFEGK